MDINCKNNCGNIVGDWNEVCSDCLEFDKYGQDDIDTRKDNHGN